MLKKLLWVHEASDWASHWWCNFQWNSDVLASVGAPPLDTATIAYKAITALMILWICRSSYKSRRAMSLNSASSPYASICLWFILTLFAVVISSLQFLYHLSCSCTEYTKPFLWTGNSCRLVWPGAQPWSTGAWAGQDWAWLSREWPTKGGDVRSLATTHTKCYLGRCGKGSWTDGGEESGREHTSDSWGR